MSVLGGLECRLVEPHGATERAVVLCHGFGAPGDNLVSIGEDLTRQPGIGRNTLFVFPAAPLSLAGVGLASSRAWWLFDFLRLAQRGLAGAVEVLRHDVPEGLGPARRKVTALLDQLSRERGLPLGRIILGGFSQGAMLATDVALHLDEAPAALCIFSGTLVCEGDWKRRAPRRAGLRVLQTHGRIDPLLPYAGAVAVHDLLEAAGLRVDFRPFEGGHTIGPEGMAGLASLIQETR